MKYLVIFFLHLRWIYFHLSPRYVKFSIDGHEMHFQNTKTGEIVSNYRWMD